MAAELARRNDRRFIIWRGGNERPPTGDARSGLPGASRPSSTASTTNGEHVIGLHATPSAPRRRQDGSQLPRRSGLSRCQLSALRWFSCSFPAFFALACESPGRDADFIITNGAIYTMSWPEPAIDGTPSPEAPYDATRGWHPDAEAVAIRDGRIVFVGSTADALNQR